MNFHSFKFINCLEAEIFRHFTRIELKGISEKVSIFCLNFIYKHGRRKRSTHLEFSHRLHKASLDLWCSIHLKPRDKVRGYGYQSIFGPSLEPIHSTARDQPGEFQRSKKERKKEYCEIMITPMST